MINFQPRKWVEIEKEAIRETIRFFGGNKSRAARALGISVRTVNNKVHDYDLQDFVESVMTCPRCRRRFPKRVAQKVGAGQALS